METAEFRQISQKCNPGRPGEWEFQAVRCNRERSGEEPGESSRVSGNKAWLERTQCALSARTVKRDGGREARK